jgi:hypothetical protein
MTGTHCIGRWWAPGPVWTGTENLAATGIRHPDRPARSESLYRSTDVNVEDSNKEVDLPADDRNRIRASRTLGSGTMTAVFARTASLDDSFPATCFCCCRMCLHPRQQLNWMTSIRPNASKKLDNMNRFCRANPHSAVRNICNPRKSTRHLEIFSVSAHTEFYSLVRWHHCSEIGVVSATMQDVCSDGVLAPQSTDNNIFRHNGNYLPVDTVSHPRRLVASAAPLWEPQVHFLALIFAKSSIIVKSY